METERQSKFQRIVRVLCVIYGWGVLALAVFLVWLTFDERAEDEWGPWIIILLLMALGVGTLFYEQTVRALRKFPLYRTSGALDDLELSGNSDHSRVVGLPIWALVVAVLMLIGTFGILMASMGIVGEVSDNIARDIRRGRDLDGKEVLAFLAGIYGLVTGLACIVFTLRNFRLKVVKEFEEEL